MATTIRVTSDNSAFVGRSLTRWPVYATKQECLEDLLDCVGGDSTRLTDVMERLGNTDTSGWTDKGSRIT